METSSVVQQSHTNGLHEHTRPADCCANTAQKKRPSTRASVLMKAVAAVAVCLSGLFSRSRTPTDGNQLCSAAVAHQWPS